MTTNEMERSKIVESSDTVEAIEECYRMGWSDGLPVVPPVDYKVREMLEMAGLTGEERGPRATAGVARRRHQEGELGVEGLVIFGQERSHDPARPRLDLLSDTEPILDALLSFVEG